MTPRDPIDTTVFVKPMVLCLHKGSLQRFRNCVKGTLIAVVPTVRKGIGERRAPSINDLALAQRGTRGIEGVWKRSKSERNQKREEAHPRAHSPENRSPQPHIYFKSVAETLSVVGAESPKTSGSYISSAWVGNVINSPTAIA
jgi:hypothetical protein